MRDSVSCLEEIKGPCRTGVLAKLAFVAATCLATLLLFLVRPAAADESRAIQFSIAAQPLASALIEFSRQASVQVLTAGSQLQGVSTTGVSGRYSVGSALERLLAGTGFSYRFTGSDTVSLVGSGHAASETDPPMTVAQADTSGATESQPGAGTDQNHEANKNGGKAQTTELKGVEVTGSRLPRTGKEGPQEVHIYTREQIEQSGQNSVSDFLNTIPSVSNSVTESGSQTQAGNTTVNLRGLPFGTTLVLINGRRVETSGSESFYDFFDLNNIPLSAVERIEVVADGSSSIYGSDAIAGVVNVILKKNLNGLEASTKYGWAKGIDESDASIAFGKRWNKASISTIASYMTRGTLDTSERAITASNDYTSYGGINNNYPICSPGNVFSVDGSPLPGAPSGSNATYAAVSGKATSGKPPLSDFNYGTLNTCAANGTGSSTIPATHRTAIFMEGSYELTDTTEVFTELLYSHIQQFQDVGHQGLLGIVGFQQYTVSASNPYNPFGTTVGVGELFPNIQARQIEDTVFFRPLVGARGSVFNTWQWEVSAWESGDWTNNPNPNNVIDSVGLQNALNSSNPATALNPFIAGSPGASLQNYFSQYVNKLTGREQSANGFIRGPIYTMASGPIEVVLGSEYDRSTVSSDVVNYPYTGPRSLATYHRDNYALFGEARLPILANHRNPGAGDVLAATLAGRHDSYDDFGTKNTLQLGGEWRPSETILLRATYANAFKAPPLQQLYLPQTTNPDTILTDPSTGKPIAVTTVQGGNAGLRPLTGLSHTFGFVYSSKEIPNLQLSVTHWNVNENDAIQTVSPQYILNNESSYPGRVVRDSSGAITEVIDTSINFGSIQVAGFDYQLNYRFKTDVGTFLPSLYATQTYHYSEALVAGAPAVDATSKAQDSGDWAPRWKGTVALGWKQGPYSVNMDGRYVGRYQDYDRPAEIGNFWLYDANVRFAAGQAFASNSPVLKGIYIEAGGVNLFNSLPQYSDFNSNFQGYDPAQADIRGRFLYARAGMKW